MSPDDARHGTTAGHQEHLRCGETACPPCVAAKTRYEKIRHLYGNRLVPAIGTRRRIRALMALGHSGADLAAELGVTYQAIHKLEHGTSAKMRAATANRVAEVYERLCMTPATGPLRARVRNKARRLGYAPPLAYNNIDDPDEQPRGWAYTWEPRKSRREILADLDAHGEGITTACRELRVTREAVERWCERHDLRDLYERLIRREQPKTVANQFMSRSA